MTRVLILGGGGREHALAWSCARGHDDLELICAPGNGGTASIAENIAVDVTDAAAVARLAREREVDLVVIGPDAAAAAGVADACIAENIAVFGPTAAAARIESSKAFAKQLMESARIPTASWVAGTAGERTRLSAFIREHAGRCAVKADGLALGKGVIVCGSVDEAEAALSRCIDDGAFGAAGAAVVVEERLDGEEVSVLALSDGTHLRVLPPARDHKRAFDGDRGPNTGGMGAVTPPPRIDARLIGDITSRVLQPCIDALRERGTPFIGCLYAGLMLTADGPRVLEFNARFGDPEAQVVLPVLAEPLLPLLTAGVRRDLTPGSVRVARAAAVGVVAAAAGYPGTPRTGDVIEGLEDVAADALVFHAGTHRDAGGALRTSGGRVLCVVATGDGLQTASASAYENLRRVRFDGMQYRTDIGGATVAALTR